MVHHPAAPTTTLEAMWRKFPLFDPALTYLRMRPVREAVARGDEGFFTRQIRHAFFPGELDEVINAEFANAANRGVRSINALCDEHLGGAAAPYRMGDVQPGFDLYEHVRTAREEWIAARNGRHAPEPHGMRSAYERVRALGVGYRVLTIDAAPPVIASLRHHGPLTEWFSDVLGCKDPHEEGRHHAWATNAGVTLYGSNTMPFSSRQKLIDTATGEVRYSSVLMKMFRKLVFPSEIADYLGVEFIVGDDAEREALVQLFKRRSRFVQKVEDYEPAGSERGNPASSADYRVTKFRMRVPIRAEGVPRHPLGERAHEQVLSEVQILTLADDLARREVPTVSHGEYKRRQFLDVFPAWFPAQIYGPTL